MKNKNFHIIGAGLSGLAAGVALTASGYKSTHIYEAAPHAGGRCRSFFDESLDCLIDNGNHLVLGANKSVFAYLKVIGNETGLQPESPAHFPFLDLVSGETWDIRPNAGKIPWWVFSPRRRIPNTKWINYLSTLRLITGSRSATVDKYLGKNKYMKERLWDPVTRAVLNTEISSASAKLLWPMVKLTFGGGELSARPYFTKEGLGPALITPAIEFIEDNGGKINYGERLKEIIFSEKRAKELIFQNNSYIQLSKKDIVIIAVPSNIAPQLLPGIKAPTETRPIVNAHFKLSRIPQRPYSSPFLGLIGGTVDWIFFRENIVSATVSAANDLVEEKSDNIAKLLWKDISIALNIEDHSIPPFRIVKEKRATFAQTPNNIKLRPKTKTRWKNIFLAGDWTDTHLPATIEGSIRSGLSAAIMARK
tara:strand:+ start:16821 stop:18083 length:1263 start_codon:yes stop_codon:yes gene_type:complete